jgi:cell division septation protein DedD
MISLLHSEPDRREAPSPTPPQLEIAAESEEFEIVMGRRQVAGVGLVAVVLLVVFSGVSYLIGKSAEPKAVAPAPIVQVQQVPVVQPVEPPARAADVETPGAPLFADPIPGAVYIQVGAVEKGVAQIWAEGLRTHGLKAFVAPGLSDRIFRVLVGPLPSPDAYQEVKDTLSRIGLETFGRKYQL